MVYKFYDFNHLYSNISYILFGICFIFFVSFKVWWINRRNKSQGMDVTDHGHVESPSGHQAAGREIADVTTMSFVPSASDETGTNGTPNAANSASNATSNEDTDEADSVTRRIRCRVARTYSQLTTTADLSQIQVLEPQYGVMQQFGIYYALGLALIFQGCFSICYHICPTSMSLQFDTTTMYIICTLGLIKFYQVINLLASVYLPQLKNNS